MCKKLFTALFILSFVGTINAADPIPSGSSNLVPPSVTERKKIIKIDTVNVEYRAMGTGCRSGTMPIGVSGMPKNSNFFTTKSVSKSQYVKDFYVFGSVCSTLYWEAHFFDIDDPTPKWVESFMNPYLICAPFSAEWNK